MKNKLLAALFLGGFLLPGGNTWAEELSPIELVTEASENTLSPLQVPLADSASPTSSEIPPLITTRPSFTDAAVVVPFGSLQVESGATYTNNSDPTHSWVLPESFFKLGFAKEMDFRIATPNYNNLQSDLSGTLVNNFGDISLGLARHFLLPGKVDLMVIPMLNIPSGANAASSNAVDPQFRVVWGKAVNPKLYLSGQVDTRWYNSKDAPTDAVINPTLIGYYTMTPKLSGFLEYGPFIPTTGQTSHYIQSGLLFLATKRQQLDVRIAVGLNNAASDFLFGFGYSFRLDGLFD